MWCIKDCSILLYCFSPLDITVKTTTSQSGHRDLSFVSCEAFILVKEQVNGRVCFYVHSGYLKYNKRELHTVHFGLLYQERLAECWSHEMSENISLKMGVKFVASLNVGKNFC